MAIATDNANNIVNAIALLNSNRTNKIIHVRCSGHIINLIVKFGFECNEIDRLIAKVRYYCKRVHASSKLIEFLSTQCNLFKEPDIKVILDCDIRWNSTHNMLKNSLRLKRSLTSLSQTLNDEVDSDYDTIYESDWKLVNAVVEFLEPFNQGIYYFIKTFKFISSILNVLL